MPPNKNNNSTLSGLLINKLQALYYIETQILNAMPKLVKKATDTGLKQALISHLKETREHQRRLVTIFKQLGEEPKKINVKAIRGIIADGEWVTKHVAPPGLDAKLITTAQYVEHYEIAGYGSAAEWAKELGLNDIAEILNETLQEERLADEKLSALATSGINSSAASNYSK